MFNPRKSNSVVRRRPKMPLSMQALRYHIFVWKFCGLWDLPGRPVWYTVWSACICAIFYVIYPACIAVQIMFTVRFGEMIDILLILPTACAGIKGFFVVLKRRKLRQLFALLQRMDDEHVGSDAGRQAVVQLEVDGALLLVRVLSVFYYSTVVASFMVAFLSPERRFMWQSWYPFDYEHNAAVYYALLVFQLVASFLVSFIYSSLDLYGSALYRVLGAHVDVLRQRLEVLGRTDEEGREAWTTQRSGDAVAGAKVCNIGRELASCVDYHNMCIQ